MGRSCRWARRLKSKHHWGCLPFRYRQTTHRRLTPSPWVAGFTTTLLFRRTIRFPARRATVRRWASLTRVQSRLALEGRRGRATLQQSLILGITHCNSGMGVLRALRSRRKVRSRTPVEMASTHVDVVKRLQADAKYVALFKQAWGTERITIDLVAKSIASFERTVLSGNSPFDRFYYGH